MKKVYLGKFVPQYSKHKFDVGIRLLQAITNFLLFPLAAVLKLPRCYITNVRALGNVHNKYSQEEKSSSSLLV